MITGVSGFGYFGSKNGRFVTHSCFPKLVLQNPYFIVFWGRARFWPGCQKCFVDRTKTVNFD